ncbi:MAG: hypothetical protein R3F04_06435 [Lysobacteraceae bacterium]
MTVFGSESSIPQVVLDAALALHQQESTELTFVAPRWVGCDLPGSDSLWHYNNGKIVYADLVARNHCAAQAVLQQLTPLDDPTPLFDAAHELWRHEIGHVDSAAGRLLGLASADVNVLAAAAQAIRSKQHPTLDVFDYLHLMEVALPHISRIDASDVVALVEAQHELTKQDLAGGMFYRPVETRLQSEPQLASEVLRITRSRMSESLQNLYSVSLQALLTADQKSVVLQQAREDADHSDPLMAGAALWTLGRAIQAQPLTEDELNECIAVLKSKVLSPSTETRQTATRAVAHAALKDERLMLELVRLASTGDEYTLTVVANFMFMNQHDLPTASPHFETLLKALIGLPPSLAAGIRNFDWVLRQLYALPEQRALVVECLSQWIVKHGESSLREKALIEQFAQTITQIANDKPGFQAVITRWLVAPELQLAVASAGFLSCLNVRGMKSAAFSAEVLDGFDAQDLLLLARRLLGYVISEELLISLTLSMLDMRNARERSFNLVRELLTEQVGRDYERATMDAIAARLQTATSPEKELLSQAYAVLQERSTANDHLPRLQELRPPTRLRRAIALNRARDMEQARKTADEKSVFRRLVTEIPLKAGRGCFSVTNNEVGPTQYLQSISHSMSLPLRSLADPVGYAMDGLHFRLAQKEEA